METQKMHEKTEVRRKRRARRWPWVLGGILILLALVLLLIPVILSSQGFTRWLQAKINRSTGGQTSIGDLSVGWLQGVRVADFQFRGENGWAEIDIDRITTIPSYSSLLSGTLALNRTVLDQPRIAIDLRERPAPTEKESSFNMDQLERLNDVIINDGTVQLTSTEGQTVQIANLDSWIRMRPPGRTSRFQTSMVVAQEGQPAQVQAQGQVTPDKKTGWSLRGTTGDVTIEVNDLNLDSLAPFLDLAGVEVQARGQVSANITGAVQDGQIENLNATIVGQDLDVTGEALQGDRLQTSQLNVRASLTQAQDAIDVKQLDIRTDWATITATGTVPKTPQSLAQLLESGTAYDVRGNFDVDLATVLSQMPHAVGLREGTEITAGRATGTINTVTEAGRATLVAKAQVAGLTGVVDEQKLSLSEPVQTTLRLSTTEEGAQLEALDVSAPFAQLSASGDFEQIRYQGQVDLARLQAELGPFLNLGTYELAGQMTTKGQVSIQEKATNIAGTLSARQVVLAAPDGNRVTEPQAQVEYALGLVKDEQVLAVDTLTANVSFGTISVQKATIPTGPNSPAPLNLAVSAEQVDLARLKPYAVFFASFPPELTMEGIAQSLVRVTREQGSYHVSSDSTRIENFRLVAPQEKPFEQKQVTALFDFFIDPTRREFDLERLSLEGPQIKLRFGELRQTSAGNTAKLQGALDAQVDWAVIGPIASAFVPDQVTIAGQRQVSINFASTYPVAEPNALLANLDGQASLGFDQAQYLGFNFGSTELDVRVENGLLRIGPLSTTVNNGKLNFAGQANLGRTPALLTTPEALHLLQGVEINPETTEKLLKYVNPIFANAVSVTGIANFDLQELAIPLTGAGPQKPELVGTLWIDKLTLGASNLLNQILGVIGESVRGQALTVRPTKITLQNGVVRYDDMQINVGDNPVNFGGSIGPNGILNMTVVLPYTYEGRTARIDEESSRRISLPLTGSIEKPELDLKKLLELQLKQQVFKGLEDLLKKRR